MFGFGKERKLAPRLLEATSEIVHRYSGIDNSEAKSRLLQDGITLESDGRGATFDLPSLDDFICVVDLRNPEPYKSFASVMGERQYDGLSLVLGDTGRWMATITDGLRAPATRSAVRLAKELARCGALYVDWDATLGRRSPR